MNFHKLGSAILAGTALTLVLPFNTVLASSHMDAPLITFDDPANTTDVYAFRSAGDDGTQYLTTALSVYPFEEPGIGPNNYRFDDNVRYEIHVALGDDIQEGQPSLTYRFEFKTEFQNTDTIRQAFLGPIDQVFGENQNLRQTYTVTRVDYRGRKNRRNRGSRTVLGKDLPVPPNNQGLVTPFYNKDDNGDNPAKPGVQREEDLDVYTQGGIHDISRGYRAFAGQRDDGFYADIQSIFDLDLLFSGPNKPFDSQGGFNVHTLALNIPLSELEGETIAGVYATTSRKGVEIRLPERNAFSVGRFEQVGRQGNPLFAEALVRLSRKDRYSVTPPSRDAELFSIDAEDPELVAFISETLRQATGDPTLPDVAPVVDIAGLFIPDLIKVDLTTGPARTPNDPRFDRLSGVLAVLGGAPDAAVDDVLVKEDGSLTFGGWPNGRRFGDDVVDIAVLALGLPAGAVPEDAADGKPSVDGVARNDITYNDVFPYAATPLNGRNHPHHSESDLTN